MVTHQHKDGHPPEGYILQTRNLTLRLNSQNRWKMMEFDTEELILVSFNFKSEDVKELLWHKICLCSSSTFCRICILCFSCLWTFSSFSFWNARPQDLQEIKCALASSFFSELFEDVNFDEFLDLFSMISICFLFASISSWRSFTLFSKFLLLCSKASIIPSWSTTFFSNVLKQSW